MCLHASADDPLGVSCSRGGNDDICGKDSILFIFTQFYDLICDLSPHYGQTLTAVTHLEPTKPG
jgi:hypothetical protein